MAKRRRKTTSGTKTSVKSCRTTRKRTNINMDKFNAYAGAFNSAIDNAIARQRRIDYLAGVGRSIGRGINWLLGRRYNPKAQLEKLKDMKIKLLKADVKKTDPIFKDMKEFKELAMNITWARQQGADDMESYHTMKAKKLMTKINKKYNKLIKD